MATRRSLVRYYVKNIDWFPLSVSLVLILFGLGMMAGPKAFVLDIVGFFVVVMMAGIYISLVHPMNMSVARRERDSEIRR